MQAPDDWTILRSAADGKELIYMLVSGEWDAASWLQDLTADQPSYSFRARRTTAADYIATGCSRDWAEPLQGKPC